MMLYAKRTWIVVTPYKWSSFFFSNYNWSIFRPPSMEEGLCPLHLKMLIFAGHQGGADTSAPKSALHFLGGCLSLFCADVSVPLMPSKG